MGKGPFLCSLVGAAAVLYFSGKADRYDGYAQQVRQEQTLQGLTRSYENARDALSDVALIGGITLVAGGYAWARSRSKP